LINFNIAADNELSIPAVGLLLCIQFATQSNDKHKYWSGQITLSPFLDELEGLYTYEKERYKLNKRGLLIVKKLSNPAASKATDEDREILEDIEAFCKGNTYFIKNKNQLLKSIVGFRLASGLSAPQIKKLIEEFVEEEPFKCFDYIFWSPESIFDKIFKLENSRLYDYYKTKSNNI
jgi:hypothetical protein